MGQLSLVSKVLLGSVPSFGTRSSCDLGTLRFRDVFLISIHELPKKIFRELPASI